MVIETDSEKEKNLDEHSVQADAKEYLLEKYSGSCRRGESGDINVDMQSKYADLNSRDSR